jgi:hypothetical protein
MREKAGKGGRRGHGRKWACERVGKKIRRRKRRDGVTKKVL